MLKTSCSIPTTGKILIKLSSTRTVWFFLTKCKLRFQPIMNYNSELFAPSNESFERKDSKEERLAYGFSDCANLERNAVRQSFKYAIENISLPQSNSNRHSCTNLTAVEVKKYNFWESCKEALQKHNENESSFMIGLQVRQKFGSLISNLAKGSILGVFAIFHSRIRNGGSRTASGFSSGLFDPRVLYYQENKIRCHHFRIQKCFKKYLR